ncbi:DUF262 domain-containing protein [Paenibacillus lutrae]|uniref:DUF262 domain-containing protein n=1 Tax=Paenibacillus lutrae TaxID=2078573 RepID=UPI00191405C1|nr:DUF262 domain-containing protein [Paenibacillus lutrae]
MSAGTIEANKEILQKIFSESFWFVIPEYQRSYVWQTDNVTELVEDLVYVFEHKPDHDYFLGSLVLKKLRESSFPEYEVLDGQQRLTTFFIMMAVLRDLVQMPQYVETLQKKIYQEENLLENVPARMRLTYKIRDKVEDFISTYIIAKGGPRKKANSKHSLTEIMCRYPIWPTLCLFFGSSWKTYAGITIYSSSFDFFLIRHCLFTYPLRIRKMRSAFLPPSIIEGSR